MSRIPWYRARAWRAALVALAGTAVAAVVWNATPPQEPAGASAPPSSAAPAAASAAESPPASAFSLPLSASPAAAEGLPISSRYYQTADHPPLDLPVLALEEPAAALILQLEPAASLAPQLAPEPLAALPAAPVADELASPEPRLASLPFRTQRDGSRWAGSNCGPAALAMVLEAWGHSYDNDHLRYLTHTYQGTWGRRGGTALEHMAQVADDFGVRTSGLYAGDAFRRWSLADVRAEVAQGRLVIPLVKYRLLPGREQSTVRFDHYIVLWDVTPDGFVYNDPIYPGADEGYARFISDAQLEAAMRTTLVPQQAVAFLGPRS
jgi:hypothetical protein